MSGAGVAVLLVSVTVAQAAVRSGTYRGKTDRGTPVGFKVTKAKRGKRKISRFNFKRMRLKCSDGKPFTTEGTFTSGAKRLPIARNGKFSVIVTYRDGGKWVASGRIRGRRARGTLRLRVRFDDENIARPHGRVRCNSGKRKFTARVR